MSSRPRAQPPSARRDGAEPLVAERLSDRLAARLIRADRERRACKPGDRLPTEAQLAAAHGVSRSVVREAVHQVKSRGLLRSRQGSGVYVSSPPAHQSLAFDPNGARVDGGRGAGGRAAARARGRDGGAGRAARDAQPGGRPAARAAGHRRRDRRAGAWGSTRTWPFTAPSARPPATRSSRDCWPSSSSTCSRRCASPRATRRGARTGCSRCAPSTAPSSRPSRRGDPRAARRAAIAHHLQGESPLCARAVSCRRAGDCVRCGGGTAQGAPQVNASSFGESQAFVRHQQTRMSSR